MTDTWPYAVKYVSLYALSAVRWSFAELFQQTKQWPKRRHCSV